LAAALGCLAHDDDDTEHRHRDGQERNTDSDHYQDAEIVVWSHTSSPKELRFYTSSRRWGSKGRIMAEMYLTSGVGLRTTCPNPYYFPYFPTSRGVGAVPVAQ